MTCSAGDLLSRRQPILLPAAEVSWIQHKSRCPQGRWEGRKHQKSEFSPTVSGCKPKATFLSSLRKITRGGNHETDGDFIPGSARFAGKPWAGSFPSLGLSYQLSHKGVIYYFPFLLWFITMNPEKNCMEAHNICYNFYYYYVVTLWFPCKAQLAELRA